MNATINGPETLTKEKTFIRYADMAEGQKLISQEQMPKVKSGMATMPGMTHGFSARGGFDKSLNDREGGMTWAPEQIYHGGAHYT
jgi:hypothetical protein